MRINWRVILFSALVILFVAGSCLFSRQMGYHAGIMAGEADATQAVEKFRAGKVTFCELNDTAKFYACPVMRQGMPLYIEGKASGVAVIYICNATGTSGFVEMIEASSEAKTQVITKLMEAGFKVEQHCGGGSREIVSVKKGPWKTATR